MMEMGSDALVIRRSLVFEYLMPLKRPFGTARGVTSKSKNFIIKITGEQCGRMISGVGEAAPRAALTGDLSNSSWDFLGAALQQLREQTLSTTSPQACRNDVTRLMEGFGDCAAKMADSAHAKPFRGTLCGIEMALLDLASKTFGTTLAEFLGKRRSEVRVSASTISTTNELSAIEEKIRRQARRYPTCRLKGTGELERDLEILKLAARVLQQQGITKPLWLDANGAYSAEGAQRLIFELSELMRSGVLPDEVLVEQPTPKELLDCLPQLQRDVDRQLEGTARDLLIVADEAVWDEDDVRQLYALGGCRAINIKIQKAGGILPGLTAAAAAVAVDPNVRIYVGGMVGTSDITGWALTNFAMALPRLDYFTATPTTNLKANIAEIRRSYRSEKRRLKSNTSPQLAGSGNRRFPKQGDSNESIARSLADFVMRFARHSKRKLKQMQQRIRLAGSTVMRSPFFPLGKGIDPQASLLALQTQTGIGTDLDFGTASQFITRRYSCGASEADQLRFFGTTELDNHLLEREALISGVPTMRLTPRIFFLGESASHAKVAFYWTCSSETARVATLIAGEKQLARVLLSRADVAVSRGQRFHVAQQKEAIQFASKLGWPVVVKPSASTAGKGVTTNIQNEKELLRAIGVLGDTSHFVLEEHIAGGDYRFLIIGDRVLSVILRDPANVIGDGQHTIEQLVKAKNAARQRNPHLGRRPIKRGERAQSQLQRQGLKLDSVPAAGQRVLLSSAGNLSQGGDSREVLDETHASLQDMAVRAVKAIPGLSHAGVDFLIPDHRVAIDRQRAAICEINSIPATTSHHYPLIGPARNVSREIIDFYCTRVGVSLRPPVETLTVQLTIRGVVQKTGYRGWLAGLANELGVTGWVQNQHDGTVQAVVSGRADLVAIIASLAITGPTKANVEMVETVHVQAETGPVFRIKDDPTSEVTVP